LLIHRKSAEISGLRYKEHPSRKFGLQKDKYFSIRYTTDGQRKEEGLGWLSEGWTEKTAAACLFERRESLVSDNSRITFAEIFERYIVQAGLDKSKKSCDNESGFFKNWIAPTLGNRLINEITPDLLEQIKKLMSEAGKKPRTIHYVLAIIRQIFNYAINRGLYAGDNPINKIKKPANDNRRMRFLTQKEAAILLNHLKNRGSQQMHDIALLSLHCGLRAGEIFKLQWNDVDFSHGLLSIKDTKSGRNRSAVMTREVRKMLEIRAKNSDRSRFVFASAGGNSLKEISNSFAKTVDILRFNDGIDDSRQKVVFHTLRHTFASWLVMSGVDLYTVQKLMGHSTIAMTERYSHLAPNHLKKAVGIFEANLNKYFF
jgi:integrase